MAVINFKVLPAASAAASAAAAAANSIYNCHMMQCSGLQWVALLPPPNPLPCPVCPILYFIVYIIVLCRVCDGW